jgi:ribosomal-protein-alanine N-acetyltransferase
MGLILALPSHAEALAAIHRAAFPPAEQWHAAAISGQLMLPGGFALLDPAGGMVLARVAADEAEILALAVIPAQRRAGRGRALLLAAESHIASAGARVVFLEVSDVNAPARALYASAGYREVGRRRRYYADGSDALVLARPLRPAAAISA